jgi:hypothetical protein
MCGNLDGRRTSSDNVRMNVARATGELPYLVGHCPEAGRCEMRPLFARRGMLPVWHRNFCDAGFARCARYRLCADGLPVPRNLLPNGRTLARRA